MSEPIEIHVFGAKIGESIVVRLPGEIWGVVDNYTPALKRPESNPVVRFLEERGIQKLAFLCLTHPHEDHYRGMSHLLEKFRPDRVWLFGSSTHRHLYSKVAEVLKAASASKNFDADDSENVDELVRILDHIQSELRNLHRIPRLEVRRLQLELPLLELRCTPPLKITALGASGGRAMEYESTLVKCFTSDRQCLVDELPRVNHNMISGGLLIEYGQARIILGGDIETEAWEETMRTIPIERFKSALIKVSHHGSQTGYCTGLWELFSPGKTAIAVIAPYSKQGLPSPEGLAHISDNAQTTLSASLGAVKLAAKWDANALDSVFQGVSADALVTLRALFPKASRPAERLEGICSFSVAEDGTVNHSLSGEAGKLC